MPGVVKLQKNHEWAVSGPKKARRKLHLYPSSVLRRYLNWFYLEGNCHEHIHR